MTIDAPKRSLLPSLLRGLAILISISAGWFALMALIMLAGGPGRTALVLVHNQADFAHLPDDVRLIKSSDHVLTVYSDEPDFVRELYKSGAVLVLPGRKSGCLDLRTLKS